MDLTQYWNKRQINVDHQYVTNSLDKDINKKAYTLTPLILEKYLKLNKIHTISHERMNASALHNSVISF